MKQPIIPIIDIKKYGGKQVAIVKGKIVAFGISTKGVLEQAKRRTPKEDHSQIWLFVVPKTLTFIYFLCD